jgi:hypothetical protein
VEVELLGVTRAFTGTVVGRIVRPPGRWSILRVSGRVDRGAGVRVGRHDHLHQSIGLELGSVGRDGCDDAGRAARREEPEEVREAVRSFVDLDRADVSVVEPHLDIGDVVQDDAHPGTGRAVVPPVRARVGRGDGCLDAPRDAVDLAPGDEFGRSRVGEVGLEFLVDHPRRSPARSVTGSQVAMPRS